MYVLHSLQGHASGFHDLINFLNLLKELLYLILFDRMVYITKWRQEIQSPNEIPNLFPSRFLNLQT